MVQVLYLQNQFTINDLSCEILVHIFIVIKGDKSSDASAACLGLTCTSFYGDFQRVYSYKIDLATSCGLGRRLDPDDWAADDLNDWPGSYRSHHARRSSRKFHGRQI